MNRWHFIEQRPVAVHGARGFSMAHAWSQGGELIATFAQEALFRIR